MGGSGQSGGAIWSSGALTVKNSYLFGNSSEFGGAIYNNSYTVTITNTTFQNNSAGNGGGLGNNSNGNATVTKSTFVGNSAGDGGGISNYGYLELSNSTVYGNSATGNGGGFFSAGLTQFITNSTFSSNSAPQGAGIWTGNNATPLLKNTIVANSTDGGNCYGSIMDGGNNLQFGGLAPNSCGAGIPTGDPKLDGLANNGGPTETMKLQAGSAAIDAGNDSVCNASPVSGVDQRGISRSQGSHCDIGAYEVAPPRTISGKAGAAGITLSYTDGVPKTVISLADGSYSLSVPYGWSGTVTPSNPCYTFTPPSRTYNNVTTNQTSQNYTAAFNKTVCSVTVGVFRPSNGVIFLKNSNTSGFADISLNYGLSGDYPVTGDWDNNGTDTIGVYRNGTFLLRNSNTVGFAELTFAFGAPGWQPIAGDWNGDGKDTIGVFNPATGLFALRNSNSAGSASVTFLLGNPGDVAIAGDWNGDGIDTVGVFRPSNGVIYLKNTNASGFAEVALNYGMAGDKPVVGDWDGDGDDTIGVYRGNKFLLRNSNTVGFANITLDLGIPGDMPIAGNWDGKP
jgi:hypothetical protein